MPRYFANIARDRPRIGPDDLPGAIGILSAPDKPGDIIGIAYGAGHTGGWRWDWSRPGSEPEYLGPREAAWRLVIGRAEVDGRLALRMGEFVEFGEEAG
jgi:hypothetical protein